MVRRFRPRFALRTLFIVLTLVPCAYFGAWGMTKRYGVPNITDVRQYPHSFPLITDAWSPMPFVVRQDEADLVSGNLVRVQRFYLWIFGLKWALPWTHQLPELFQGNHRMDETELQEGMVALRTARGSKIVRR